MTKIGDLIELPKRVDAAAFVLKLSEGVARADETLDEYVVTPQLVGCFEQALGLIQNALATSSSKAAYLHGSFGSGKSHFMAVLHELLRHNPKARAIPELAEVVRKHSSWLDGKEFLLPTYHMLGAHSMEAAIFSGYVDYVRRLHPEAPIPAVYVAESIFENARMLREQMGDDRFFTALSQDGGGGGWGEIAAGWDAESFEAAAMAAPGEAERRRLVSTLVTTLLPAYGAVAAAEGEGFLDLDEGLSVISQHARSLGYDAVVLFLDELILWLASRIADHVFVARETPKLAKLVEARTATRPAPLVSFVARQRDLTELVGKDVPGVERLSFSDNLRYTEGRFDVITLEDRNLPAIAEKRLLRPRSEAARQQIDAAFEGLRREVVESLLTDESDRALFRQTYPFSPAFVKTLVAASSALQRERTALKVMAHLLAEQGDELELGELVPVGELYDAIASGDEPVTDDMRQHFERSKRLYQNKLRPLLLEEHGITEEEAEQRPRKDAFRADDRLMKTIVLAALVPDVEPLRGLTAARLAALNHGEIKSPIPGREAQLVLQRVQRWRSRVGEIRMTDEVDPVMSVQLADVDVDAIIERAKAFDVEATRLQLVQDILLSAFEIADRGELTIRHEVVWRGSRRGVEVLFADVVDVPDAGLRASGDEWRLVIDYPFGDRGPRDDTARLEAFRDQDASTRTVVWLPNFLMPKLQAELGRLVIVENLLQGERLETYTEHLSPQQRLSVRPVLDSLRSALRARVENAVAQAYGVVTPSGDVEETLSPSEQFQSLDATFAPRPPVGPTLGRALGELVDQMLSHQFAAHPEFGAEARLPLLRTVLSEARRAIPEPNGRIEVEQPKRAAMRHIAAPLRLGEMYEVPFILGRHWVEHFERKLAGDRDRTLSVAKLRGWLDDPEPMGLDTAVQNLVIFLFAEQTGRSFFRGDTPVDGDLEKLDDTLELRVEELPSEADWTKAVGRASPLFGISPSPLRNAANVAALVADVRERASAAREACVDLVKELDQRLPQVGVSVEEADRVRTARGALVLVEALATTSDRELVRELAHVELPASDQAMGRSTGRAAAVVGALRDTAWAAVEGALAHESRNADAHGIAERLRQALRHDELAAPLAPALEDAESAAIDLLRRLAEPEPKPPPTHEPTPEPEPEPGIVLVTSDRAERVSGKKARRIVDEIRTQLDDPALLLTIDWRLERKE